MVYVKQVCWQLASRIRMEHSDPARKWKTPGDRQRNCPKHVEFHSKNRFEKLVVHLFGFIIGRLSWSCSQAVYKPVWHIPLLCVLWKTPGDRQRNCPKQVEFYSKNRFEKLVVHLVGFIIGRLSWSCSQAVYKPVWQIPLLCVLWKTLGERQRNCLKHVEFHSKNKFEKLVHLVGFIVRNVSRCTVTWTSNTFQHILDKDF